MNIVLIVPTGVGADIGGHAGDANPVCKLFASLCDNLITHPNVVNASDINEMPDNVWYTEGSFLNKFLQGEIKLRRKSVNKILCVCNEITPELTNSVNAARHTIGADIKLLELNHYLQMKGWVNVDGSVGGEINGADYVLKEIENEECDVVVVSSLVEVTEETIMGYLHDDIRCNPWGYVEAMLSKKCSKYLGKQVVHAPIESKTMTDFQEIVSPRKGAELVSATYIHCCFKGAHRAPVIAKNGMSVEDIDFMVSPYGVYGTPHEACIVAGIPIIYVKENNTIFNDNLRGGIVVENYWEAAGYISCYKAGVLPKSTRK